jgi:hypothetical protein
MSANKPSQIEREEIPSFLADMPKHTRKQAVNDIVRRMMSVWGCKTKKALAKKLDIHEKTPVNWASTGTIPAAAVLACQRATKASFDWLYFGTVHPVHLTPAKLDKAIDEIAKLLEYSEQLRVMKNAPADLRNSLAKSLVDKVVVIIKE